MHLSPLDHELLGGSDSPPTTKWTGLLESMPTGSLPLLSQEKTSLCSWRRQTLHMSSGFHVSSIQGLCSHRNLPPTFKHPILLLYTLPHTNLSKAFCAPPPTAEFLAVCHSTPQKSSVQAVCISSLHILSSTHTET